MKEELDKKLVEDFSLLYSDRYAPMTETCMCWGFPGDGWEPLIRELSEKLEPLIRDYIKEKGNSLKCRYCGEPKYMHDYYGNYKTEMFTPYKIKTPMGAISPFWRQSKKWRKWHSWKRKLRHLYEYYVWRYKHTINKLLILLHKHLYIGKKWTYYCKGYQGAYPRASQVKEKYGTLRFYMDYSTKEMQNFIRETEDKSKVTCEQCGKLGKLRTSSYWLQTLCDKCEDKRTNNSQ